MTLYRVTCDDFCCGLIYDFDPPICVKAAPKLEFFLNKGIDKLMERAEALGWTIESLPSE